MVHTKHENFTIAYIKVTTLSSVFQSENPSSNNSQWLISYLILPTLKISIRYIKKYIHFKITWLRKAPFLIIRFYWFRIQIPCLFQFEHCTTFTKSVSCLKHWQVTKNRPFSCRSSVGFLSLCWQTRNLNYTVQVQFSIAFIDLTFTSCTWPYCELRAKMSSLDFHSKADFCPFEFKGQAFQ